MSLICQCGNCQFEVKSYKERKHQYYKKRKKAGTIILCPKTNRFLLVQSRGNLWGFPKGSLEEKETFRTAAIRETREETGIVLTPSQLMSPVTICEDNVYFNVEIPYMKVSVQCTEGNDANGICWITMDCLENLINRKEMKINSHTRRLIFVMFNKKMN